ncbi:MAG: HD domain-containing protein [Myxococcales bacterium]|nr:HD domain-containing protein [Myxococcales bacterium]
MSGASVRLAELVSALSLGIDLGFGQPMEHVLRQSLIALRIADELELDESQRVAVYYASLLLTVGCHSDAHEQAKWFGDDIALKADKFELHGAPRSVRMIVSGLKKLGAGQAPLHRFRLGLEFLLSGHREVGDMITHHAALARALAEKLALPQVVLDALACSYERWDGQGFPNKLARDQIPIAARIPQVAEYAEVAHRMGGRAAIEKLARDGRKGQFDPALLDRIVDRYETIFADLDRVTVWDTVIAAEPALAPCLGGEELVRAMIAIGDFVDLKSPYFLGHARGVADLAAEAASSIGLTEAQRELVRQAGLVHGLGRLGISNAIWDKRGPLGAGEWERVRLQPYLTGRMLRQSEALAPIARIAVQHRERLDGSGYPNGLTGNAISAEARILAAADAYQAMCEPRPHRPALPAAQAAALLRGDVKAGRYDGAAVEAVLGAAGHRVVRRREGPAGLTVREVEVLKLLARGMSNKDIASALFISAKTVANHVEHIYAKISASTRAAAGLFAMQHGLLPDHEYS